MHLLPETDCKTYGLRPERFPDFEDVGPRHHGWQQEATKAANNFFMSTAVWPRLSLLLPAPSSGLKVVRSLDSRFLVAPRRHTLVSSHKCSVCSCFDASPSPCLPLSVPAGVAVSSTALATTVQRALQWECWAVGGSPWSLLQHAFAERLAVVSRSTHSSET